MDTIRPPILGLFYDTETTGLPLFKEPSEHPDQPHIVQLGALLVDMDSREIVRELDVIIRPTDWTIADEVAKIHGITTERALTEGIPEAEAISELLSMWGAAEGEPLERIGHNEQFDARIVRIGLKRFMGDVAADAWKAGKARCTAAIAGPIVKCPPTARMKAAGRHHFKTPTLQEAYQHFFGRAFEGAHGARADTRACMEIFFAVQDLQQPALAAA
jgi:DNA polymerase-3 subunit epsilon